MLLIPTVEMIVGEPVTTWPRVVLQFLFFIPHTAHLSYDHSLVPVW